MVNNSSLAYAVQVAHFEGNKLKIDTEAFIKIIEKAGLCPLSIVSINGPLRSGKSYIIGYFLRYLKTCEDGDQNWFTKKLDKEFHWLNSADRQTTGIYMWSDPFFIQRDGQRVAVLLMDTQGCFDDKTTLQENSQIFTLSCLLSSTLIFNIKNQLSEEILQFMQLFVGFARMNEQQEGAKDTSSENSRRSEESEVFSKLVFLIRDWQFVKDFEFGYHDDTIQPGRRNFKKEKFDPTSDMIPEVRIVRDEIISSFQSIGCCLIPYPGEDLAIYDNVEKASPRFIEVVKDFVPRLFSAANIVTKKIGGQEINGNYLKKLIKKWADEFNKMEVPAVSNFAESTSEIQNKIAASNSLKFYHREMADIMKNINGLSDGELVNIHKKNMEEALSMFKRMKRLKNEKIQSCYFKDLEKSIHKAYKVYEQLNLNARRFSKFMKDAEEKEKELNSKIESITKNSEKNEENFKREVEEIKKKSQDTQQELNQKMEEMGRKSLENIEELKLKMKNEAEAEVNKVKMVMQKKIQGRLREIENVLQTCISDYEVEIDKMIRKVNAVKSYADEKSVSGFGDALVKTTFGLGVPFILYELNSKLNDLIKEMELFETKQKLSSKEFLASKKEAFSTVDQLMECLELLIENSYSNIPNVIFHGRKDELVKLDMGFHIRRFKNMKTNIPVTISLSEDFEAALVTEKRHCQSLISKLMLKKAAEKLLKLWKSKTENLNPEKELKQEINNKAKAENKCYIQ